MQTNSNIPQSSKPFVVALTGGIASGKTTVSNWFAQQGVCIVDADMAAREVVAIGSPALAQIQKRFGDDILTPEKALNRQKLRDIVFNVPNEKHWLEALLHPMIRQHMAEQLKVCTTPYAIAVIPLLVETGIPEFIDDVCVVDCSTETQRKRLAVRDNLASTMIENMLAAQASRQQRLALANQIINNDEDETALINQLPALHQQWLTQAITDAQLTS
jgi:dephospho-CoA kinase